MIEEEKNQINGRMNSFRKSLINAANSDYDEFTYYGKNYPVVVYDEYVQTLINNRILYRVYIDDNKNSDDEINDFDFN